MRTKITKSLGRGGFTIGDVKLTINKNGGNRTAINIAFYNDSFKKTTTTEYVVPSIDEELGRLYFETANSNEGFKLTSNRDCSTHRIVFVIKDVAEWEARTGSYNLLYDAKEKLYYIDFANKFKV